MGQPSRAPRQDEEGEEARGSANRGFGPADGTSSQQGISNRPAKAEQSEPNSGNDHQKTVSGKKQHGPPDKIGQDAGGNEGSKGQNVDSRRSAGTGKEPSDIGDDRGEPSKSHRLRSTPTRGRSNLSRKNERVKRSIAPQGAAGLTSHLCVAFAGSFSPVPATRPFLNRPDVIADASRIAGVMRIGLVAAAHSPRAADCSITFHHGLLGPTQA